ncbi:MAG TPA: ShlB/FhaC/HecB family hemolysin secretion/activation protein [Ramlibacter sp.]|nr:ShlB/FhaC/HecB family hemolysin secretion/activation protein [Ramlibacter sp.]
MKLPRFRQGALGAALLMSGVGAWAQAIDTEQAPGRLAPAPQRATPPLVIDTPPAQAALQTPPDATRVTLKGVQIEGASTVAPQALVAELGEVAGRSFDLASLRALAATVQQRLRNAGLPFARAFLPAQDLADGVLRIQVVEGRYGQVTATGDEAGALAPWLAPLQPGDAIRMEPLERTLMLLSQLPGVQASSVLRPGALPGTGDLEVQATVQRGMQAELGIDNHGSYHAGRERVRGAMAFNSPFMLGDRLHLQAAATDQGTWLGSVAYTAPIGAAGWRAGVTVGRSQYQLGQNFAALDARGTADTVALALSYPLAQTQDMNVTAGASWQHKRLRDQQGAFALDERKRSDALALTLNADRRDDHGVTWGVLTLTPGRLRLDDSLLALDSATAQTQGSFTRLNLDAARIQQLSGGWSVQGRVSGQWANGNLDSSEKFVLGGVNGVRAWPNGEAVGDEGWLVQLELRWRNGGFEPYAFVDSGRVRINHRPWAAGQNQRGLDGAGLGMRMNYSGWTGDLSVAWRGGGVPVTDPSAGQPQVWFSLAYRF